MFNKIREWKEKGYFSLDYYRIIMGGGMTSTLSTILKNPLAILKANKIGKELAKKERKDEKLPYEIPEYKEGMPYCDSNEKYLRLTRFCESDAPEIIAMANKLGAFKLPDREYVENAFEFVKRNIKMSYNGRKGAVDTLIAGDGPCALVTSVFIALCRAGGIPARYKFYKTEREVEAMQSILYEPFGELGGAMQGTTVNTSCEVKIDGKWIECDPILTPEFEAGIGVPIGHFGEGIKWGSESSKYITRMEAMPLGGGAIWALMMMPIRGIAMTANDYFEKTREKGKKILEEMGEEEYDKKARKSYRVIKPRTSFD